MTKEDKMLFIACEASGGNIDWALLSLSEKRARCNAVMNLITHPLSTSSYGENFDAIGRALGEATGLKASIGKWVNNQGE